MKQYEIRTKKMERQLQKLKDIIQPLKEKSKKVHSKINVKDIKFKSIQGKTRGFRNVMELNKFITKETKKIDKRKLKIRERQIAKKNRETNKEALKKLEKEIKLMKSKEAKLKGKRKLKIEEERKQLEKAVKEYKVIKKKKPQSANIPSRKGFKNKQAYIKAIKNTVVSVVSRERTSTFAERVWGIWELVFGDSMIMSSYRQTLYDLSKDGKLSQEDIDFIGDLFDELYELLHSEDYLLFDSRKLEVITEIENILEENGIEIDKPEDLWTE